MIFPPLRTPTFPLPPAFRSGVGLLVSARAFLRPLKTYTHTHTLTHTGRKYITNQAENTAGSLFSTLFFFPLSFFPRSFRGLWVRCVRVCVCSSSPSSCPTLAAVLGCSPISLSLSFYLQWLLLQCFKKYIYIYGQIEKRNISIISYRVVRKRGSKSTSFLFWLASAQGKMAENM